MSGMAIILYVILPIVLLGLLVLAYKTEGFISSALTFIVEQMTGD